MSIESKVFEALSTKVQAESKKIEFALVDDIENYKNQMLKLSQSAQAQMFLAEREVSDYGKLAGEVKGYATLILQDIAQLETKTKEIGIDLPSNILQIKNMAKEYFAKGGAIEKFASSFNVESAGKF
jgi:hypothetical protein